MLLPQLGEGHGHRSGTACPTAFARHVSASVAVTGKEPDGAQMHSGSQVPMPTATVRMKRQSVAVGEEPLVTGWLQSPFAAWAPAAPSSKTAPKSTQAALRSGKRPRRLRPPGSRSADGSPPGGLRGQDQRIAPAARGRAALYRGCKKVSGAGRRDLELTLHPSPHRAGRRGSVRPARQFELPSPLTQVEHLSRQLSENAGVPAARPRAHSALTP